MAVRPILSPVASSPPAASDPTAEAAAAPASPKGVTAGRRWRLRRNLVIYIASQNGVSQRMLADVFDLPHSRIAAILKELRTQYGSTPRRSLE